MQGAQVRPWGRELDPTHYSEDPVRHSQINKPLFFFKGQRFWHLLQHRWTLGNIRQVRYKRTKPVTKGQILCACIYTRSLERQIHRDRKESGGGRRLVGARGNGELLVNRYSYLRADGKVLGWTVAQQCEPTYRCCVVNFVVCIFRHQNTHTHTHTMLH